ncbi:MAG: hypothetical protein QXP84_01515 [Candidatus Korarchaeum sp.]
MGLWRSSFAVHSRTPYLSPQLACTSTILRRELLLKSRKQAISVMLYIVFFSVVLKAFKHGVDLAPDVLTLDLLSDSDFGRRVIPSRSPKIMLGDYLHVRPLTPDFAYERV